MREEYKKQVNLLLSILPEIAKEECFALHGGTAINLFVRDMPRLSVDIDLTYLPLEDFEASRINMNEALKRIVVSIQKVLPDSKIHHDEKTCKLIVNDHKVSVKVEVSLMGRGSIYEPQVMELCKKAQKEFNAFVETRVLNYGLLFGGKICAALDRQHPRDLFDVLHLLNNEGFTDEVKSGFLFYLLGHSRPMHEILAPNLQDQSSAMETQFSGMTTDGFNYKEFEKTREQLIKVIHQRLTESDKNFLMGILKLQPDWTIYDFKEYPGVKWKLLNLEKLKSENPEKYQFMIDQLQAVLNQSES
ncbi:MAG: nucleotidyl transferase AbiEii/AbiGii toxin family protein [Bacteroidetes bacterium]|nr:nucleotidyl transferase AbiEii/AbiGii toxin family protein [Bacteroidota bacterium]